MKQTLFLLFFGFCIAHFAEAQVKIGNNPQTIDPASVLELESTDKVLVITRVTTAQMNAITPLQGAMVFNTDIQRVHYYDGTQWVNIGAGGGGGADGINTAESIVNVGADPTIVITPTANGDNFEVAPGSISTAQIANGGINGTNDILDNSIGTGKLQDQSVTQEKLSENSVGAFALDNNNIGLSAFNNDVGYITGANIVSTDGGNALQIGTDNAAYYDESPLINAIQDNEDAINNIGVPNLNEVLQQGNNTLGLKIVGLGIPTNPDDAATKAYVDANTGGGSDDQNLILNGNLIEIEDGNSIDLSPILGAGGSDDQNLSLNGNLIEIEDGNTIDLTPILGGGGGAQNLSQVLIEGNDANTSGITNLTTDGMDPTAAANVAFVNNAITAGGSLTDGTILVGDATNDPIERFIAGDATLANTGTLTISPDAIVSSKIANATILAEDLNQMGASNGQVLKWDDATTSWITAADDTGTAALNDGNIYVGDATNAPQGVTMSGDATIDNMGALTIVDDAIELNMIAPNGATADGDILKWNNTTTAWEVGANTGHVGTSPNNIFYADTDGTPIDTGDNDVAGDNNTLGDNGGFMWDPTKRFNSGTLFLGYKLGGVPNTDSNFGDHSKLSIAERFNEPAGTPFALAFPIQLVNESNVIGGATGMLFAVNTQGNPGKGALIYERTGAQGEGDFHFISSNTDADVRPAITEKVLTIEHSGDVVLTGNLIGKNGAGTPGQVLTTTAAGTEWANPSGGGGAVTDTDTDDGLSDFNATTGYDIQVDDTTLEISGTDQLQIKDGGVSSAKIAVNAIQGSFLGGGNPSVIIPGTIGTADIGANAIGSAELQAQSVGTSELKDGEVTTIKISPGAEGEVLTTTGGAVTWSASTGGGTLAGDVTGPAGTNVIANNAVNSAKILDLSITGADIQDLSITTNKIVTDAVTDLAIAAGAVRTDEILDGTISDIDINGAAAIAGSKIVPIFTQNVETTGVVISGGVPMTVPDYVFQKYFLGKSELDTNYEFKKLEEIEAFVQKYHHLPGITSAKQFKEEGSWNLSKSNLQNLEKIEELFLHTINQEHKIKKLESENQSLSEELKAMQKDLQEIKTLLKNK